VDRTRCPSCSAALRPDAQWCGLCYLDLRPAPEPAIPAQPMPAQPVAARQGPPRQPVATQLAFIDSPVEAADGSGPTDEAVTSDGAGTSAEEPVRRGGWPCTICSILVPIDAKVCPSCGTSFLATLQAETAAQAPRPGPLMRLPRAARLTAALVLSLLVAVVVPLLLTLLG
jgi:ribosomal protein S27AE